MVIKCIQVGTDSVLTHKKEDNPYRFDTLVDNQIVIGAVPLAPLLLRIDEVPYQLVHPTPNSQNQNCCN